ncbi:MAG: hypothetical protein ACYSRP_10735 [Planctomycetota bacterium]|jgi:hypothetical protein
MKKLVVLIAVVALALCGFVNPPAAAAFPTSDVDVDGAQGGILPDVDIVSLTVVSNGATDAITVTLVLEGNKSEGSKYRIHFDYTDTTNQDGDGQDEAPDTPDNTGCLTTSDDTSKHAVRPNNKSKDTGPGTIVNGGNTLTYTVTYAELGLVSGDDVLVWADAHNKGIQDRSPDTLVTNGDSCSKPQELGETVAITLD